MLNVVDCHAEGESGKVVVGGVGDVPGETMFDKRVYLEQNLDQLRELLLFEPRGAVWHNANIVLPSNNPRASLGYVILESTEYPAMSGSNTMCVATVLLETGMLPMVEPVTELVLESPAGLIRVHCECRDGKVLRAKLFNQPAFVYHSQVGIDVPGIGRLDRRRRLRWHDLCPGRSGRRGVRSYTPTKPAPCAKSVNKSKPLPPSNFRSNIRSTPTFRASRKPPSPGPSCATPTPTATKYLRSKNAVIVSPGRVDRSPCGTGTSARLAVLHDRGDIAPGELFRHESLIGSSFDARVEELTTVGNYPAIVPSVSGRSWITSFNQLVLDPSDPFPHGYTPSDTWMSH